MWYNIPRDSKTDETPNLDIAIACRTSDASPRIAFQTILFPVSMGGGVAIKTQIPSAGWVCSPPVSVACQAWCLHVTTFPVLIPEFLSNHLETCSLQKSTLLRSYKFLGFSGQTTVARRINKQTKLPNCTPGVAIAPYLQPRAKSLKCWIKIETVCDRFIF